MTDDERTKAEQEAYLNEHLGGGVLGVSPEQVHQFVESQQENTTGSGLDGGQSRSDAPTSYPGDIAQPSGVGEPPGESPLEHVDEHITTHWIADKAAEGLAHGSGYEMGGPGAIAFSTVVGMESDQPKTPEQRREEEELAAMKAREEEQKAREQAEREEWERQHPGMNDEPDASVGDATTR